MAKRLRIFPQHSAVTLRPRLACEITLEGVVAARQQSSMDSAAITAFAPLLPGSIVPALNAPNFPHPARIVAALRQALDQVVERDRKLTLVIPDAAVRVLLLDFDSLPDKTADVLPIIRFRLRKLLPFEVDDAAISYQVMTRDSNQVRALVAVTPTQCSPNTKQWSARPAMSPARCCPAPSAPSPQFPTIPTPW